MMNSGTVIQDRRGSYRQPSQRSCPPSQIKKRPSEHSRPGILIFSYDTHLLYMNPRAIELTGHLDPTDIGPANDISLVSIQEFRVMIQQTLDQRKKAGIWPTLSGLMARVSPFTVNSSACGMSFSRSVMVISPFLATTE